MPGESTAATSGSPLSVKPIYLFLPLLVAPICGFMALFDWLCWHGRLMSMFPPGGPKDVRLFAIFFGNPHIVAGLGTLFWKENLRTYGTELLLVTLVALSFCLSVPMAIVTPLFIAWTWLHFAEQQAGVAALLLGRSSPELGQWKWLAAMTAITGIMSQFLSIDPSIRFTLLFIGGLLSFLVSFRLTRIIMRNSRSRVGRHYMWLNLAIAGISFLLFSIGYSFLMFVVQIVLHDLTAFVFYMIHDHNRNLGKADHPLYRTLNFSRVPVVLLCPLAAVILALPYDLLSPHFETVLRIASAMGFAHYWFEGRIWVRGTSHRRFVMIQH